MNKTPHFGNDHEYADEVMVDIFNAYYAEVNGRPTLRAAQAEPGKAP
jgi:formate C-acetyltransferase